MEEIKHELQLMGLGCSCGAEFCNKWKKSFPTAKNAKLCPQCKTRLSIEDFGNSVDKWHCLNCNLVFEPVNAAVV